MIRLYRDATIEALHLSAYRRGYTDATDEIHDEYVKASDGLTSAFQHQTDDLVAGRDRFAARNLTLCGENAALHDEVARLTNALAVEQTHAANLRRQLAALDADPTAKALAERLATLQAATEAMGLPPGVEATPDEIRAHIAAGLAPLIQRQADNDRIREHLDAGDPEAACAYAEAVVAIQTKEARP